MHASAAAAAVTLDQLLQQVKNTRAAEAEAECATPQRIHREPRAAGAVLAEAQKAQAAADARSKALSTEFDTNEKEINEVTTLLKQRDGNLGELFGVTRQVAGDTATSCSTRSSARSSPSATSSSRARQGEGAAVDRRARAALVRDAARDDRERRGRALRAPVVQADGRRRQRQVVRIGRSRDVERPVPDLPARAAERSRADAPAAGASS